MRSLSISIFKGNDMRSYERPFKSGWTLYFLALALFSQTAENTPAFGQASGAVSTPDLSAILKKAAEYSDKLESVIFDFYCLEKIEETIDPLLDVLKPYEMTMDWTRYAPGAGQPSRIRTSYSYDYQCLRNGGKISEKRVLLEENGRKKNVPDAALQTASFVFGNSQLAPVSLFAERYQSSYDYSIVGTEKVDKVLAVIIEVKPKTGAVDARCSYGKAWIDSATADILRIEWRDTHVGNWDVFKKRGERFLRTPRLTMRSELKTEKNGVRFPSALNIEEAYVNEKGRAFIRSKVKVVYSDFKFFKVEVEVK
jgi:hypothetical protein